MVLVKQRKLSFGERFYFKTIIVGLIYTFGNLFKKKITRNYPEEKLDPKPSLSGVPVLVMDEEGNPRCVACGLCEFVCPPRAIEITGTETERPMPLGRLMLPRMFWSAWRGSIPSFMEISSDSLNFAAGIDLTRATASSTE